MLTLICWKILYTSPRNSIQAHLSLIAETDCQIFLLQSDPPPVVSEILKRRQMRTALLPPLAHFLDYNNASEVKPYPFPKTFESARYEPFVCFQTSGSTGMPKPIVMTHGTFATLDAHQLIPELGGIVTSTDYIKGSRLFNGFPHYHTGYHLLVLGYGVFYNVTTVIATPGLLTANLVNQIQIHGKCTGLVIPPSLLNDMCRDSIFSSDLGSLKYVAYGGGPLSCEAGDQISAKTKLFNWFGSTEAAFYPIVIHNQEWEYVEFSPLLGHEFRLIDGNQYELVFVRNEASDLLQGVFCTYPELTEYATKELYSPHPSIPSLWKSQGRLDDIIAFSNAEKFNPVDSEAIISSHPAVTHALVAGHGRFQASLIIEPIAQPGGEKEAKALTDQIWPTVETANDACASQGRIERRLVMLTKPDKPMLTTGKATIRKRATINAYEEELDELYNSAESPSVLDQGQRNSVLLANHQTASKDALKPVLKSMLVEQSGKKDIKENEDLSILGLDSLHVTALSRDIQEYVSVKEGSKGHLGAGEVREVLYSSQNLDELGNRLDELQTKPLSGIAAAK